MPPWSLEEVKLMLHQWHPCNPHHYFLLKGQLILPAASCVAAPQVVHWPYAYAA